MDWSNRVIAAFNSPSPSPVPGPAAVMSNDNDADHIDLHAVDQGIEKTVERQRSRVARAGLAPVQEAKRSIEFIGEITRCDERAFADVPIDSGIGIGLSLVAKTDPRRLWRR